MSSIAKKQVSQDCQTTMESCDDETVTLPELPIGNDDLQEMNVAEPESYPYKEIAQNIGRLLVIAQSIDKRLDVIAEAVERQSLQRQTPKARSNSRRP